MDKKIIFGSVLVLSLILIAGIVYAQDRGLLPTGGDTQYNPAIESLEQVWWIDYTTGKEMIGKIIWRGGEPKDTAVPYACFTIKDSVLWIDEVYAEKVIALNVISNGAIVFTVEGLTDEKGCIPLVDEWYVAAPTGSYIVPKVEGYTYENYIPSILAFDDMYPTAAEEAPKQEIAFAPGEAACYDSDDTPLGAVTLEGDSPPYFLNKFLSYAEKGYVEVNGVIDWDECSEDGNKVYEWACDGDKKVLKELSCDYAGCRDGACVICETGDLRHPYVKGYVRLPFSGLLMPDSCGPGINVKEYQCILNDPVDHFESDFGYDSYLKTYFACPHGCDDGACICESDSECPENWENPYYCIRGKCTQLAISPGEEVAYTTTIPEIADDNIYTIPISLPEPPYCCSLPPALINEMNTNADFTLDEGIIAQYGCELAVLEIVDISEGSITLEYVCPDYPESQQLVTVS